MNFASVLILSCLLWSMNARANFVCSSVFNEKDEKTEKLETESQNGKPRYYSVRNYSHFKDGELDNYLKSIHNLTQFSEKLAEVSTFVPDRTIIPSEAYYVANRIIPLIEEFLQVHDVNFRIETYEKQGIRRTLVVIEESGNSNLNKLSSELWNKEKVSLVVDPMELFYGYDHYNQSIGKFFDIDAFNPGYALSFHLLLHSQRKDFNMNEMSRSDKELEKRLVEMRVNSIQEGPKPEVIKEAQEAYDEKFRESRAKAAAHMNKLIEEAKKKGSSRRH